MQPLLPYLLTCAILFVSSFTRSALGFGDALVAMPFLVLTLGIRTAAPVVALVGTTIGLVILWRNRSLVELQTTWRLILSLSLGIPVGLVLLKDVSEPLMQGILGLLLLAFSLYNLLQPRLELREDRYGLVYGFGFAAGVLGGAYNTAGPPIVVYGHLRRWAPERFRATLQGCFFPAYLLIVVGHGCTGLLTLKALKLYGLALPVVLVAIFLGGRLNASIPRQQFIRYVNVALMLIGVGLGLQALESM